MYVVGTQPRGCLLFAELINALVYDREGTSECPSISSKFFVYRGVFKVFIIGRGSAVLHHTNWLCTQKLG